MNLNSLDSLAILLLLFAVSGGIVTGTVYLVLKKFFENDERKRFYELRQNNQRITLPIRLQAYERLALLLERISVNQLLLRANIHGKSAAELMFTLQSEIRAEFEHNLSQQIYVAPETWEEVVNAKEKIVKLINTSFSTLPKGAGSIDLSNMIFENSMRQDESPVAAALEAIKNEAKLLF